MKIIALPSMSLSNAAGTCKIVREVKQLSTSALSRILVGSATLTKRLGNPGTNHYQAPDKASINSLGLSNPGRDYYLHHLPEMVSIAHAAGKKLDFSIAPLAPEDTALLGEMASITKVDAIELNAGCPNVWTKGGQKKILSFDLRALEEHLYVLLQLRTMSRHALDIRVKLSPYSDPSMLEEAAALVGSLGTPRQRISIVTANTFPNALMFKQQGGRREPAIPFGEHLGGFSGDPYRAIALGQVAQFRKLLPKHPLIGVGGISHGQHIHEYLSFKVKGVQIGSAYYYTENPRIFSDVLEEMFYYSE